MLNTKSVSIIIVNYNTPSLTIECVNSIFDNVKSCRYEVIIIDNSSSDNSAKIISSKFRDRIVLIESPVNLGFGRANNLGATKAQYDYLFFLNSDTVLKNDPFDYFFNFYYQTKNVGALGTYLFDGKGNYTLSGGYTYSIKKYLKTACRSYLAPKMNFEVELSNKVQKVDYVIGADIFISAELFNEVGGFDPKIFMYFEDVKLCRQLNDLGFTNYLIPGPRIIHYVSSSSASQFSRVHNTSSMMYCISQKSSNFKFRIFQSIYFILKLPIIFKSRNISNEIKYLDSIINYKKYLNKDI